MGAGLVQHQGMASYVWKNATQAKVGQGATLTADEESNLADAVGEFPLGILTNAPKQNEHANIHIAEDVIIMALCGAAITAAYPANVVVTVDSTGRFITAAKSATPTTTKEWAWGFPLKSTTAADQRFPLLFSRIEMDIT